MRYPSFLIQKAYQISIFVVYDAILQMVKWCPNDNQEKKLVWRKDVFKRFISAVSRTDLWYAEV